jgi:hypothetical protein
MRNTLSGIDSSFRLYLLRNRRPFVFAPDAKTILRSHELVERGEGGQFFP